MKKLLSVFALIAISLFMKGQVVPMSTYSNSGADYKLIINNSEDFEIGAYGGEDRVGYKNKCASNVTTNFKIKFPIPAGRLKYTYEIMSYEFNSNNGLPEYLNHLMSGVSFQEFASTTVQVPAGSEAKDVEHTVDINVVPNRSYYVLIKLKKYTKFGFQAFWRRDYTNIKSFVEGGTDSYANGSLNNNYLLSENSYYGTQPIFVFDKNNTIILDGSLSSCEDRYQVRIEEFNLMSWTAVPGTEYTTGWILNEAPVLNLTSLFPSSFAVEKIYRVSLIVGLQYSEKSFFIRRNNTGPILIKERNLLTYDTEVLNAQEIIIPEESIEEIEVINSVEDVVEISNNVEMKISAYPNPTKGNLVIQMENTGENTSIIIYDINGKIAFSQSNIKQNKLNIDLSEKAKGMYFVKVISEGNSTVKRVVLQ